MGNIGSAGATSRRRHGSRRSHPPPPPPQPPHPEIAANRYVYPAGAPYNVQYPVPHPNAPQPPPGYYQYPPPPPGYYPPHPPSHQPAMSMPLPAPYDHHGPPPPHVDPAQAHANWAGGRYPCGPPLAAPTPYVEHQKAMTIRNDVNLKKETLRVDKDVQNPGKYLVSFTFDATVAGSITVIFFAKEGENCQLEPLKESILPPVKVEFQPGLGQKFLQPSGTGIDFSMFEEGELIKAGEMDVYPLAVKAETASLPPPSPLQETESEPNGSATAGDNSYNAQITQAVFDIERGEYHVKVVRQILWVNGTRYELQEIYGIGNSVEHESSVDGNDSGKECVICLSEPRDTTVLPCRHMCMCSGCAKVLRFQTNRCPICRQPVERLLEIKVSNNNTDEG